MLAVRYRDTKLPTTRLNDLIDEVLLGDQFTDLWTRFLPSLVVVSFPGYNPFWYGSYHRGARLYASPAFQYQLQPAYAQAPLIKFKQFTIQVVREAVAAPQMPQTFQVQCPPVSHDDWKKCMQTNSLPTVRV